MDSAKSQQHQVCMASWCLGNRKPLEPPRMGFFMFLHADTFEPGSDFCAVSFSCFWNTDLRRHFLHVYCAAYGGIKDSTNSQMDPNRMLHLEIYSICIQSSMILCIILYTSLHLKTLVEFILCLVGLYLLWGVVVWNLGSCIIHFRICYSDDLLHDL